jgi:hypothetical protein
MSGTETAPTGTAGASPSRRVATWQIVVGGVTALIVAVTGFFALFQSGDPGGNNTNTGSGNCVVQNSPNVSCPQGFPPQSPDPELTDEQLAAQLRKENTQTDGPWRFMVLFTETSRTDPGLKVRSGPGMDGHQIGSLGNRQTLWAECDVHSGFNPLRGDPQDAGDRWLKIHWPSTEPERDVRTSDVSDPVQGWVYAGLVVPNGHNGQLPACPA